MILSAQRAIQWKSISGLQTTPSVPPIPPTAPDNVRAAHSLPGYDVELLELLPVEDEAPGMSSAVNQLENESK